MSGPQPTPQPAPTPTVTLPQVPPNTYELLSSVADAIDTANGNFNTHATKLGGISTEANGAVNNVTSTSQGSAATALSDTWKNTQTDVNHAHDPLTGIIAKNCMGGSPNPFRETLNQNKSSIQTGLTAMENIQAYQQNRLPQPPTSQQLEGWIQDVNALTNSLGNVNMALQVIILAIRNLNGGFAATCVTGFTPGVPPPTFPKNAFASMSSGGSGSGGGKISMNDLESHLKSQGVDPGTAESIALNAEILGLNLDDVQALLDTGKVSPGQFLQWLESGKITDANLSDVTTLTNQGVSSDAVNQLLNNGADLKATSANVQTLLTKGVDMGQVNQLIQKGVNLKYAEALLNKGVDINWIVNKATMYTTDDPAGLGRWNNLAKGTKSAIADAINRWATGTTRFDNDGTTFQNNPPVMPKGTTPPYTEYTVSLDGTKGQWRIVVDAKGKIYFFDHYNFSGGQGKPAALPVPASWIMNLFK